MAWTLLQNSTTADADQVMGNFDFLQQNIVPINSGVVTDNTYTLGTSTARWSSLYVSSINAQSLILSSTLNVTGVSTFSGQVNADANLRVGSNSLFVNVSTNRVGIGTTSPAGLLHVIGSGTNSFILIDSPSTTAKSSLYFGDLSNNTVGGMEYNHNGDTLTYLIAGSATAVFKAGQFAFNHLNPSQTLDVSGTFAVTGDAIFSGDIGVGDATPNTNISILGSSTATDFGIRMDNRHSGDCIVGMITVAGQGWSMGLDQSDTSAFKISNASTNLATNNRFKMTVAGAISFPSGTLAINHDNASQTLDVSGNIRCTGSLTVDDFFRADRGAYIASTISPSNLAAGFTSTVGIIHAINVIGTTTIISSPAIKVKIDVAGSGAVTFCDFFEFPNVEVTPGFSVTVSNVNLLFNGETPGLLNIFDSGTTKATPSTVSLWLKVRNGTTQYYIPCFTSKTS